MAILFSLGCESNSSGIIAFRDSVTGNSSKPFVIDLGIVLQNRVGYFCISMDKVGVSPDDEIASISSTCDCLQPSVITCLSNKGLPYRAILLRYGEEPDKHFLETVSSVPDRAVNLEVNFVVETTVGASHRFAVTMLHSIPLDEAEPCPQVDIPRV